MEKYEASDMDEDDTGKSSAADRAVTERVVFGNSSHTDFLQQVEGFWGAAAPDWGVGGPGAVQGAGPVCMNLRSFS